MTWEPMTLDEFAKFQKASGVKVIKVGDVWWRQVHPFFFRPLFPFAEVAPGRSRYPLPSRIGGVIHMVPAGAPSNSFMNMFVYDQLKDYSLDGVGAKQRNIIKKALSNFTAKRITDLAEFVDSASPLYISFYSRTKYSYHKERLQREKFRAWAKPIFEYDKVVVTGAYRQEKLCAIDISYQVENVIIDDVFFSDTESQALKVTDFIVHTLRDYARTSDAGLMFRGFPTGKQSLDNSKITRGCSIHNMAAFTKINPVALHLAKALLPEGYQKLLAVTAPL
ncbi:hypothetical protein [Geomonas propionica]|uniref:Uncharacterized protein n=1 Tax=Geomonas propionica TaxID=2798582 RepID=A0ABS0YWN8_9BACT|nr:hypothetical protein [Geomonas propionica]MBJ6802392.1 hypothetical protein [Geomonas propionica]